MRTIDLGQRPRLSDRINRDFLLLGDATIEQEPMLSDTIMPKIRKEIVSKVPGLWGTLGMMNDTPVTWEGLLNLSEYGNENSQGATLDEIHLIQAANPHLKADNLKVIERFISFEDVLFQFPKEFAANEIPRFRLTLMVEPNEGALVYYEYYDENAPEEKTISYIMPQATDEDNTVDKRDRLTYFFDALPPKQIIDNEGNKEKPLLLSNMSSGIKFLIKALTYKRGQYKLSDEAVKNQLSNIAETFKTLFEKHPDLLVYDVKSNYFRKECTGADVDTTLKTLLLIHGTFGSTESSYGSLISSFWLKKLIEKKIVEQVIAFDHPTVFEDAQSNINTLLGYFKGMKFSYPVDVMGSSQGGLLAQYLANLPADEKPFEVGNVALVASANGVEYVNTAYGLEKILSILKVVCKGSQPALAFICALAQNSVKFVVKQPGIDLMKPGSNRLNQILNNTPATKSTVYLPVIDDYTNELVKDEPFIKRMAALGLDLVIRLILGKYNDWVVQTENQFRVPQNYCAIPSYDPTNFVPYIYPAIHGKCLDRKDTRDAIETFLT